MEKKALIIDDAPGIIHYLETQLGKSGYMVISAENGKAGLQKVKSEIPDLIILDVILPELNGSVLCGVLKFDEQFKKIPVILLTVKDKDRDKEIGRMVRADAYMTKPFDMAELKKIIRNLIGE